MSAIQGNRNGTHSNTQPSPLRQLPAKLLRGAFWTAIMAHFLVRAVAARGDEAALDPGAEIAWDESAAQAEVWAFEPEGRLPRKPRPRKGPGRSRRPRRPAATASVASTFVKTPEARAATAARPSTSARWRSLSGRSTQSSMKGPERVAGQNRLRRALQRSSLATYSSR